MTGTSIIMPDAVLAQSGIIASQWAPEGVAPLLASEFVFDGGQASSLINRAAPTVAASLIGTPTFNLHTMTSAGSTQGVDSGKIATEADQTYVAVLKAPTAAGGIFASLQGGFTGILYGVDAGKLEFYNSISGAASPNVPAVIPVAGGNFFFVCGWGSIGGPGNIRTAAAGALNATTTGALNSNNARPTTTTTKVGGATNGSPTFEIAYAARAAAILDDAAQLAWYLQLKARLAVTVA